jgi:renal tumor antigen
MVTLCPDLRIVAKLGEGSFADVFKVKSMRTGEFYAVKRLKKRYHHVGEVHQLGEVIALQALRGHPNVIDLVELTYNAANGYVAMVFELMDCNVYELISQNKRPFDERTTLLLVFQLLKAVAFMHSKSLFHRDIKPENCLVNRETLVLKMCDFGSTRAPLGLPPYTEYVSTRWYRAPECILTSGSYGSQVDEWAVGCMLYELMTTRPLFPGKHELDQITRIHNILGTPSRELLQQFKRNPNQQISFTFPPRTAQDLRRLLPSASPQTVILLSALLTYNPQNRISAADALHLECFRTIRNAEVAWEATDKRMPFPLFYARHTLGGASKTRRTEVIAYPSPAPDCPKPTSGQANEPSISLNALMAGEQEMEAEAAASAERTEVARPPISPPDPPKPTPNSGNEGMTEARAKAAQRMKTYRDALKTKNPIPFHDHAFQLASSTKPSVSHKPKPQLVQPRLARLIL